MLSLYYSIDPDDDLCFLLKNFKIPFLFTYKKIDKKTSRKFLNKEILEKNRTKYQTDNRDDELTSFF